MSRLSFIVLYPETRINLYRIIFYNSVILRFKEGFIIWLMISPSGFLVVHVPSQNLDFYHLLWSFWGLPEVRFVWLYLVNYLNCYFQSNCEHTFWPAKLVEKVREWLLFNSNSAMYPDSEPTSLCSFSLMMHAHQFYLPHSKRARLNHYSTNAVTTM